MSVVGSSVPARAAFPLRLIGTSIPCQRHRINRKAQTRTLHDVNSTKHLKAPRRPSHTSRGYCGPNTRRVSRIFPSLLLSSCVVYSL